MKRKQQKRIKIEITNRVNGMLEQGGVCGRIVSYPCWLIAQIMDADPQDVQPNDGEYWACQTVPGTDVTLADYLAHNFSGCSSWEHVIRKGVEIQ